MELTDATFGQEEKLIQRYQNGRETGLSSFLQFCEESYDADPNGPSSIRWLQRREYLSQWLESLVQTTVETEDVKSANLHPYSRIFKLLALHMVEEATICAEDNGRFRLASLLSQVQNCFIKFVTLDMSLNLN